MVAFQAYLNARADQEVLPSLRPLPVTHPTSSAGSTAAAPTLSIGELAARAGVRTSAIRYYESVGLLPPAPRAGRYRRFTPETAQLIATLRFAQRAGFTVAEIRTQLERAGQISAVRSDLTKGKALEWLAERAEVVDPDGTMIDRSLLEPPSDDSDTGEESE